MIPIGYMAKRVAERPEWLVSSRVTDVLSVSPCVSGDFADYIDYWKHNGYWLFDSPELITSLAREHAIDLQGARLFFYEAHELQFDGEQWESFGAEASFTTNVVVPAEKRLEGFDVVTFWCGSSPEHSPLSCNGLAEDVATNQHCLFETFKEAERSLNDGVFQNSEPGPYRIIAVYSVDWP